MIFSKKVNKEVNNFGDELERAEFGAANLIRLGNIVIPTDGFSCKENIEKSINNRSMLFNFYTFEDDVYMLKLKLESKKELNTEFNLEVTFDGFTIKDNVIKLKVLNKFIEKYYYLYDEYEKLVSESKKTKRKERERILRLANKFIES